MTPTYPESWQDDHAMRWALASTVYQHVFENTESFEEQHVGADLAYLLGAILHVRKMVLPAGRQLLAVLESLDPLSLRRVRELLEVV